MFVEFTDEGLTTVIPKKRLPRKVLGTCGMFYGQTTKYTRLPIYVRLVFCCDRSVGMLALVLSKPICFIVV